jgi:hypothetical protein
MFRAMLRYFGASKTFQVKMMTRRTIQIAIGMLFMLSLLASSVSACTCQRHLDLAPTEEPSCHSHAGGAQPREQFVDDLAGTQITPGECCCVEPAPKAITKSDKINSESEAAAAVLHVINPAYLSRTVATSPIFEDPFFLLTPFYNLTPGRAPPRL